MLASVGRSALCRALAWIWIRVSMIGFKLSSFESGHVVFDVSPLSFPNSHSASPVSYTVCVCDVDITAQEACRCFSARHVDLLLISPHPIAPRREARSEHLQLEERTLLCSLDRSASVHVHTFMCFARFARSVRPVPGIP